MQKMELAFYQVLVPQNLENTFGKLVKWATPKELINSQTKMITIYHDSFKITEANKVRMSA